MRDVSQQVYEAVEELLGDIPIERVPHRILKEETGSARAVIRTGEFTPYANVILVAGVVF
jgi:D-ribose pyranase